MKKAISANSSLIMSIIELVIGILLFVNPVGFTSGIIIAVGVFLMLGGAVQIIRYFRTEAAEAAEKGALSTGILYALFGGFCAFRSGWFIATFPVITVLYGILILITGIGKLQKAVDMLRIKQKYWFVALISSLFALVFAILILANPFASTSILWGFIAVTLILEAVMDVITFVFSKRT